MITLYRYLTCGGVCYSDVLAPVLMVNAQSTVEHVNAFLADVVPYKDHVSTSGYRSPEYNASLAARGYNPAAKSNHMLALACDVDDADGTLDDWCMEHAEQLEAHGLWFEHPAATKGWCHLQVVPYGSFRLGKPRWFYP